MTGAPKRLISVSGWKGRFSSRFRTSRTFGDSLSKAARFHGRTAPTSLLRPCMRPPLAKIANKTLQPPIRAQRWFQSDRVCSRGLRLNVEPLGRLPNHDRPEYNPVMSIKEIEAAG